MYNNEKQDETFRQEQQKIIKRLEDAGIRVSIGKRVPKNGNYSGVVGDKRKVLNVNLPSIYEYYKPNEHG
ncbi:MULTISPECIES: hypothetical protein [Bacillaceae]|uniref:hypothetical protein n=1 Tax=Bacillaceae TaxID=186817 RepID=UPI000BFC114E|nr:MULTISPECIES: hypothetical protein [Bacillaceae]PGT89025.1 hypothetical protein COD11_04945 [Bacillus sp. AFS040349]UGB30650.1 hypothetical protein LPC09_23625 [Metabacillus sp. B2-18]